MTHSAARPLRRHGPRRWGALAALALLALGCGDSPVMATYDGEDWTESFMQADFTRYFNVHVPDRPVLGPAAPLVLAFHGVVQTSEDLQRVSGLDAVADAEGFIVVYLQAAMGAWDVFGDLGFLGLDELGYVREVIDRVGRMNVIDRDRIIAVGISNGGVFAQRVGCKLADRVAGFVAIAASMPKLLAEDCTPARPISVRYILGTVDGFFPAAGNQVLFSFEEAVGFWARANGCVGSRFREALPDAADDGTVVYRSQYRFCDGATRTVLDSVVGGGHAWPGSAIPAPASFGPTSRDISANVEIARFLDGLPRN